MFNACPNHNKEVIAYYIQSFGNEIESKGL